MREVVWIGLATAAYLQLVFQCIVTNDYDQMGKGHTERRNQINRGRNRWFKEEERGKEGETDKSK